jgi:hypothetical protein
LVWRRPNGDVSEALKRATFAKGDKVVRNGFKMLPAPRWYRGSLSFTMERHEYDQIHRTGIKT